MGMNGSIIDVHLAWLRAGGASSDTIDDRAGLLGRLDRDLPYGVEQALPEEIQQWLGNPAWSQSTRATYYNHIVAFYKWAVDPRKGWHLDENPADGLFKVRHPNGVPRPWTDEQIGRLLREAVSPWNICVRLAAYGGLRCMEMAGLDRRNISEQAIRLYGKGRKERVVPTHPEVWQVVRDLPHGPVIRRPSGLPVNPNWISIQAGVYFRAKLGMQVTLHQGRHWYATNQLAAGASIRVVQENLGHSSLSSTQIYTAVATEARMSAVAALPVFSQ